MKHLKKISRPKEKKPTYSPRGQIGKIITLSLIGVGVYLLISRKKAFAEEIPEEFTPAEKSQDQLTKELYELLPPSTIMERATEAATAVIKEATEAANIEVQQIKEATAQTIAEIIKKANEDMEALKKEMEASTMSLEDAMQEYRARDEVVRAEADQKIELARIEAEQKDQAVRAEAERKVEAARIEAEQKVEATRLNQELENKKFELNKIETGVNISYPDEKRHTCSSGSGPCKLGTRVHFAWSNIGGLSAMGMLRVKYEWSSGNFAHDYYSHNIQVLINGIALESFMTYQTGWITRDNIYDVRNYLRLDGSDWVTIQLTSTSANEEDWYSFRNVYLQFQFFKEARDKILAEIGAIETKLRELG